MKNYFHFKSLKRKILLLIVGVSVISFLTTISIGSYLAQKREKQLSEKYIYSMTEGYAAKVRSILQQSLSAANTLACTFADNYDATSQNKLSNEHISRICKSLMERNRNFVGIKVVLDPLPSASRKKTNQPDVEVIPDSNFFSQLEQLRFQATQSEKNTHLYWFAVEQEGFRSIIEMKPDDYESKDYYLVVKKMQQPFISTPYSLKIQDKRYELITISTPVIFQNIFYGIIVIEIPIESFREIVDNEMLYTNNEVLTLISENNTIVASTGKAYLSSQDISKLYRNIVINNMDKEGVFSYEFEGKKTVHTTSPIHFPGVFSSWNVHYEVSEQTLTSQFQKHIGFLFELIILIIIILCVASYYIASYYFAPLLQLQNLSKEIALGNLSGEYNMKTRTLEVANLKQSILDIRNSLLNISEFAIQIGRGELTAQFSPRSSSDVLGISLIKMKESLSKAKDDDEKRKAENEIRFWTSHGITQFSDTLRKFNNDLEKLTYHVIVDLVEYLQVNQGAVFTINNKDITEVYLELVSAFAYNRQKYLKKKIHINEGLAGACAREKKTMYLNNIPDDYVEITSGLGHSRPRYLLLVPLISEDKVMGVIELASFKPIEKYKIEFVEKVGEGIASTLFSVRIANETNRLLEQSREQTEAMAAQEEELRQNIEELQATKEEMDRQNAEFYQRMYLYIQVLDAVPYYISVTNRELNWIFMNKKLADSLGLDRDDLDSKKCTLFGGDICKSNDCAVQKLKYEGLHETYLTKAGKKFMVHTDYIYDKRGDAMGQVEIMTDVTNRLDSEKNITNLVHDMRALLFAISQSALLFELDLDGNIVNASEMMEKMLGYSNEEIIGIQFKTIILKEDIPKLDKYFRRVTKGRAVNELFEFTTKKDTKITTRLHFNPIKDDNEVIKRILVVGTLLE